jgi:hypothetical protein
MVAVASDVSARQKAVLNWSVQIVHEDLKLLFNAAMASAAGKH